MKRALAIQTVLQYVDQEIIVHANGMIGRESFAFKQREYNFYMIGSMGVNAFIGLGMALTVSPEKPILVFDGDGNILMGLSALCQAGYHQLSNFYHIVFDNQVHGSTGNQPTISDKIHLDDIARACAFSHVYKACTEEEIHNIMPQFLQKKGPCFFLIKVDPGNIPNITRVTLSPEKITQQVRDVFLNLD